MRYPRLEVDLDKIRHNARVITERCAALGIEVMGVTKACCGMPEVARAMLEGGVQWIADSRLDNLKRLREGAVLAPMALLRLPMPSEAEQVVELADLSFNSEIGVVRALGKAAARRGQKHRVALMVDMGDLREGVMPRDALHVAEVMAGVDGIELSGVATNFACFAGVVPSWEKLREFAELARRIEERLGNRLQVVSGGNSSSLELVWRGEMPAGVNQLRIGEGILLGLETIRRRPIPGTHQDAFVLLTEVVETKHKPALPEGAVSQDAFGRVPAFTQRGIRRRAIVALGRQDAAPEGLRAEEQGMELVGASSDHLVVDVTESPRMVVPGGQIRFRPMYGGLVNAMTSPYVLKHVRGQCLEG